MTEEPLLTVQWTPSGGLPRRVTFESFGNQCLRTEYEWNGKDWRNCGSELTTDCAQVATDELPIPESPPTLEELLRQIESSWEDPDPPVLVFEHPSAKVSNEVVAAVEGHPYYRTAEESGTFRVSKAKLEQHLKRRGLPSIRRLSETRYDRTAFTETPPER